MNKAIALTLYRRPDYTQSIIDSIEAAYDSAEHNIYVSCDFNEEHEDECRAVDKLATEWSLSNLRVEVYFNYGGRKGVDLNKLFIIPKAYEYSDYMIFLEDDTPIAPDGLRFFEAMRSYAMRYDVISISGYNRYLEASEHERVLREEPYHIDRGTQFTPWTWAMSRQQYDRIIGLDGEKYKDATGEGANGLFDHNLCDWMRANPAHYTIYPVLPRGNHTGEDRAEHTQSAEWLREHELAPFGSWSQPMPDPIGVTWTPKWHE